MQTMIVKIPADQITDWDSFHAVFRDVLGFPGFYGCNMNAWIDCMSYVDDPWAGMTRIHVNPGELLALQIDEAADFARRCPEQYQALIECVTFVNYRFTEAEAASRLALILSGV